MAKKFETDPGKLWEHGHKDIPEIAARFSEAAWDVDNARFADTAFAGESAGSGLALIREEWTSLRDTYQNLLTKCGRNVDSTGEAVVQSAEDFAQRDNAAATEVRNAAKDTEDPDPTFPKPPKD